MMFLIFYMCHLLQLRLSIAIIDNKVIRLLCSGQVSFRKINGTAVMKSKEKYKNPLFLFEMPRVTLRESHDEDEVDGDESDEVSHDHPVNHHDEWSDRLEAPAEE